MDGNTYTAYSPIKRAYCKKAYAVNDVTTTVADNTVTLLSGGYSSELKPYDTSVIYYIKTDVRPTPDDLVDMQTDENKYTSPLTTNYEGYYITAQEVITSTNSDITLLSKSEPVTTYIAPIPITVTLDPNGGSLNTTTLTVTYDQPYGTLPQPERTGYQFIGWYLDKQDKTTKVTSNDTVETAGDHTLYAYWKKETVPDKPNKPVKPDKPKDAVTPQTTPSETPDIKTVIHTVMTNDSLSRYVIPAFVALGLAFAIMCITVIIWKKTSNQK